MTRHSLLVFTIALVVATPLAASADEKQSCVSAFEQAQRLRKAEKLRAAREQLHECAQEACPAVVRGYCRTWFDEVERALPTVVIVARDAAGRDTTDVKVSCDGAVIAERLGGSALPVDPGEHTLRFEHSPNPSVEQKIVVREGQKLREVAVTFAEPLESASVRPPDEREHPGPPALAFVFAGLGVAGIGSFAYFGLTALHDEDKMRRTCAPLCDPADADAITQKNLISGISLGVGVVSLGIATWLFLRPRGSSSQTAAHPSRYVR